MCACVLLLIMFISYLISRVWSSRVVAVVLVIERDVVVLGTSGVLVFGCAALAAAPRGQREAVAPRDAKRARKTGRVVRVSTLPCTFVPRSVACCVAASSSSR
mgnify:CR=1 FL=1